MENNDDWKTHSEKLPSSTAKDSDDDDFVNCKVYPSLSAKSSTGTFSRAPALSNMGTIREPLTTVPATIREGPAKSKPAIIKRKDETDRVIRVGEKGKIHYFDDQELGRGATSTVYKGYFEVEERTAGVKKINKKSVDIFQREIDILRKVDSHVNVVRYFASEDFNSHYYIAMELGQFTLEQCVDRNVKGFVDAPLEMIRKYILHACEGLEFLHRKNILHRDIKPTNIVIFQDEKSSVAKLVDFGVSRKLSSMTEGTNSLGRCTSDWMSPEGLMAMEDGREFKTTPGVDIFSLGATIFYALSGGTHPFGKQIHRLSNIVNNPPNLKDNDHEVALINLLSQMMNKEPKSRPSIGCVLEHPYFWNGEVQYLFINEISNALNLVSSTKSDYRGSSTRKEIENLRNKIDLHMNTFFPIGNWNDKLCPKVRDLLIFRKPYSGYSAMKLVEFIRDKFQHSSEWSEGLKSNDLFGNSKETYMMYFSDRFPALIPVLYTILQTCNVKKLQSVKTEFFKINVNAVFPLAKPFN